MNEASKVLPMIRELLDTGGEKQILDLGCGTEPIVPWAVGVDDSSEQTVPTATALRCDISDKYALDRTLQPFMTAWDIVFSSHALEHLNRPVLHVISAWSTLVKLGGHLVLWLPDERYYQFDVSGWRRNPAHRHYLIMDTVWWAIRQLPNLSLERLELYPLLYSFLIVAQRV